jgi:hypothetical protein
MTPCEDEEVALELERGARLRVRRDLALGPCELLVSVESILVAWETLSPGEELVLVLQAGHCEVVLEDEAQGWTHTRSLRTTAGEESELVFGP